MPRLYAGADAYVLPSRGEGWGRPYMEALAMGLPTIASRFSGNLEFMDDETSWLIDGELVPVAEDAQLWTLRRPQVVRGRRRRAGRRHAADRLRPGRRPGQGRARPRRADPLLRPRGATAHRIGQLPADVHRARYGDRRRKPVYAAIRGRFGSVDSLASSTTGPRPT